MYRTLQTSTSLENEMLIYKHKIKLKVAYYGKPEETKYLF